MTNLNPIPSPSPSPNPNANPNQVLNAFAAGKLRADVAAERMAGCGASEEVRPRCGPTCRGLSNPEPRAASPDAA